MPKFEVVSDYQPSGDQPEAIAALAEGIENGLKEQILLGVTGSGKTFTTSRRHISPTQIPISPRTPPPTTKLTVCVSQPPARCWSGGM